MPSNFVPATLLTVWTQIHYVGSRNAIDERIQRRRSSMASLRIPGFASVATKVLIMMNGWHYFIVLPIRFDGGAFIRIGSDDGA